MQFRPHPEQRNNLVSGLIAENTSVLKRGDLQKFRFGHDGSSTAPGEKSIVITWAALCKG